MKVNTLGSGLWLFVTLCLLAYKGFGQIRYFRTPTLPFKADTTLAYEAAAEDSIVNDTLFQMRSKEGFPVAYYRKIRTSVCFDNKCRLLKVNLYWNPTGRYLGFVLDKGEFLSKAKHKPFKKAEYARMSDILADPFSPLATLAYSEIAPSVKPVDPADEVDGVSSATAKNVLDYVVEGAAYTTYKMWHVVYGPTQEEVTRLTQKSLSPELLLVILDSPDGLDKRWGLDHIRGNVSLTPALQTKLFTFINGDKYNLTERAIHALDPGEAQDDSWQVLLADKLAVTNYATQKLIINKFKEVARLDPQAKKSMAERLPSLNGELINNTLDVFQKHRVTDVETCRRIVDLLNNPNQFVARKAFSYLEKLPIDDQKIAEQLKAYKLKIN
ncbi:hypothetical protein IC229_19385 [Spirosoma sp. BT702]|uniref:Uncharacterized protein n=1 Tax=Spirosoma profusum TaxID=2771354 RepID=A0A926XXY4_9BACT|nr:hypothetical protein [Spirosoma profusum]MBD2702819.1 hypothetical protein [Spirosoma profusum]